MFEELTVMASGIFQVIFVLLLIIFLAVINKRLGDIKKLLKKQNEPHAETTYSQKYANNEPVDMKKMDV